MPNARVLQAAATALIWVGLALCFLGIAADCVGIDKQSGIGFKEILLVISGAGLFMASTFFLWLLRGWQRFRPHFWSTTRNTAIILSIAVLITAADIYFSSQVGMLASPPSYDGIGYIMTAKSAYLNLQLLQAGGNPDSISRVLFDNFAFTPFWEALMLMSFWLFGEGEWQAFTIRFWPTWLLLLLMFWVVRRRGCATTAWVAVLFTALLPTISVALRTSGWGYFAVTKVSGLDWYLADLRPDLLFAVLLLWTVVPLIEHADNPDRASCFVSGTAGALAILTKSSTMPVLLLAGGLAVIYVLIVNRHRFLMTLATAAWGLFPFAVLLTPWVLVGGPQATTTYLSHHLTVGRPLWSNPNATFLSEASFYWQVFPYHMGRGAGWLFLGLGLLFWIARLRRKESQGANRLLGYLLVAGAVYGVVSATPNKNFFVGLPYYLLLWVFSWAALAPFLAAFSQRSRMARTRLIMFSALYGGLVVGSAFYALHRWPVEGKLGPRANREATQQIAGDLRGVLTNDDTFLWVPVFGYPAALQYYMMDEQARSPQAVWVDPTTSPPIPQFLEEEASRSKAVLVFEEDIEEVAKYFWVHPMTYPYFRAVAGWIQRPGCPYRLVRTYRLWGEFPDRPFLVYLYVREPERSLESGGN